MAKQKEKEYCECRLNEKKVAGALGLLFAFVHVVESVLVLATGGNVFGLAVGMHFIAVPFIALPFNVINFALGTFFAGAVGVWLGWTFAVIWNNFKCCE